MTISATSSVAYDPSCVQHHVRIVNSVSKGFVFDVLDADCMDYPVIWEKKDIREDILHKI